MKRETQIGALTLIAVLSFVLIGATDHNVAAWFTFGMSLTLLLILLRGHVDDVDRSNDFSCRPRPRLRTSHRTTS